MPSEEISISIFLRVIRLFLPVPVIPDKSILFSFASFLTIGESCWFLSLSTWGSALISSTCSTSGSLLSSTAGSDFFVSELASPPNSMRETPTSTVSPSSTNKAVTFPEKGEGTSVSTLSVEISRIGSSSFTSSPTETSHLSIVPSVTVSPS